MESLAKHWGNTSATIGNGNYFLFKYSIFLRILAHVEEEGENLKIDYFFQYFDEIITFYIFQWCIFFVTCHSAVLLRAYRKWTIKFNRDGKGESIKIY